jgi:hypothetical protein
VNLLRAPSLVAIFAGCSLAVLPRPAGAVASAAFLVPDDAKVTPDEAEAGREDVRTRTMDFQSNDAALELETAARQSGDPELFLDAARAYNRAGRTALDRELVDKAVEQTYMALDILHFLDSPAATDEWRPVASSEIANLIEKANDSLKKSEEVRAAIQSREEADARRAEQANAPPPPAQPTSDEIPKAGKALTVAGGVTLGFGIAGIGAGVAGLVLGSMSQSKVEEPTIHGEDYDVYDQRGKLGNTLAYVGLSVGGVLTAIGIPLVIIGKRRTKKGQRETAWQVTPTWGGANLAVRF